METARQHADKRYGTEEMTDLSEFNIPLSSAIVMMENYAKGKNLPISNVSGSAFVIMHQKQPLKNILFRSEGEARNYVKMNNPKRNFKEPKENVFECKRYGTKYEILEVHFR